MIYLNNAATSYPKPKEVIDAITTSVRVLQPAIHRGGSSSGAYNPITSTRKAVAELFGVANHERIVFTSGSTEALNLAIKGMDLAGKHVIATSIEHNSVLRPLYDLVKHEIITLDIADCDETGFVEPQKIVDLLKSNTALVVINHCSNVTGTVQNISEISRLIRDSGAKLLLDASQSAGYNDISVSEMGVDMLAFTGHKSMYGIGGTGGLYISEDVSLKPLKIGGTGFKSNLLYQPEEMPTYFEAGTPNTVGITALGAGVNFIKTVRLETIRNHKKALLQKVHETFENDERITIYRNIERDSYSVFCFNISVLTPDEVSYMLESSFGIKVRSGLHCCPLIHKHIGSDPYGTVRASPSYFTTEDEIDVFIKALKKILANV